jgi:hypothetical protein
MSDVPSVALNDLPQTESYKPKYRFDESRVRIPLDAWGNPIIFVPAGGLAGVHVDPVRSPDGRPFFASAGADGDFATGDDNLYSF